jgi:hypothetical protein
MLTGHLKNLSDVASFYTHLKCLYSNLLMDDETFMITLDVDDIIVRKERRTNKKENRKRKKKISQALFCVVSL